MASFIWRRQQWSWKPIVQGKKTSDWACDCEWIDIANLAKWNFFDIVSAETCSWSICTKTMSYNDPLLMPALEILRPCWTPHSPRPLHNGGILPKPQVVWRPPSWIQPQRMLLPFNGPRRFPEWDHKVTARTLWTSLSSLSLPSCVIPFTASGLVSCVWACRWFRAWPRFLLEVCYTGMLSSTLFGGYGSPWYGFAFSLQAHLQKRKCSTFPARGVSGLIERW